MEMKKELKKLGYVVPTAISVGGFALVKSGVEDGITTRKGFVKVFVGRTLDLLDGYVARLMGWSTVFGKFADASLDKGATLMIRNAAVKEGLVPKTLDNAIVAQQTAIGATALVTRVAHPDRTMVRSEDGAYAMAGAGLALGGYAAAEVVRDDSPELAEAIRTGSHVIGAVATFHYGAQASRDYISNLFQSEPI